MHQRNEFDRRHDSPAPLIRSPATSATSHTSRAGNRPRSDSLRATGCQCEVESRVSRKVVARSYASTTRSHLGATRRAKYRSRALTVRHSPYLQGIFPGFVAKKPAVVRSPETLWRGA